MNEHTGETTRLSEFAAAIDRTPPDRLLLGILAAIILVLGGCNAGAATMRSAETAQARNERTISIQGNNNTVIVTEVKPQAGLLNFGD